MRDYVHRQTSILLRRFGMQVTRAARDGDPDAIHDLRVSIRRLSRCLRGVRKRRRAGQPEADKQRDRFIGDGDMAIETFDSSSHAIEPSSQRGLQPAGAAPGSSAA